MSQELSQDISLVQAKKYFKNGSNLTRDNVAENKGIGRKCTFFR